MKKLLSLALIYLWLINNSSGQNLVPNPDFEEYFNCPQSINTNKANTKVAPHWNSPNYGTPDLYNRCSKYQMGTQNVTGVTNPFKGDGFAGIVIWEKKRSYREYLQVKLNESLKTNQTYIISFRYKLSTYSKYCVDRMCFSLATTVIFYDHDSAISIPSTYCKIKIKPYDSYTGTWELMETEYTAKGGERYLTIGNFHDNANTKATHLSFINVQEPMLEHASYYYIDDVSVSEKISGTEPVLQSNDTTLPTLNGKVVKLSNLHILNNVLFDYDSQKLLQDSYHELNEVIAILKEHPDLKIKISGHTDNSGSDRYNQTLSERRAQSVKNYLISQGISEGRIQTKGYGKSKPIVTGTNEKSKKMNRRVEVQFAAWLNEK
jgi:OmpA-OmpF porin, OOP family